MQEALRELVSVYVLYTDPKVAAEAEVSKSKGQDQDQDQQEEKEGEEGNEGVSKVRFDVNTLFDPAKVPDEVRREVKERVAQRIRELENAVQFLEERATAD